MILARLSEFFTIPILSTSLGPEETAFVVDPQGSFCTFLHPRSGEACRLRTFGTGFDTRAYPQLLQKAQTDFDITCVGRFTIRIPYFSCDYVRRAGPFYLFVFTDASCAVGYPEIGRYINTDLEARQAAHALGLEFLLTPP